MQTPELSVPGKISHEVVYLNKGQDLDTDGNKIVSVISGKIANDKKRCTRAVGFFCVS